MSDYYNEVTGDRQGCNREENIMYTKTFQVVQYLADTLDSYVTSGQLGAHLGVSSRMILRYVKEAEALGRENGFEIRS